MGVAFAMVCDMEAELGVVSTRVCDMEVVFEASPSKVCKVDAANHELTESRASEALLSTNAEVKGASIALATEQDSRNTSISITSEKEVIAALTKAAKEEASRVFNAVKLALEATEAEEALCIFYASH